MRRIAYALLSLLFALPLAAQTVTVTASNIVGINGMPLGNGYLCLTPVAGSGAPTGFVSNGKQYYASQQCWHVFGGVAQGVIVPDTSQTSPAIGYLPVIKDSSSRAIQTYTAPFYPTSLASSFDTWQPGTNPVPLSAGLIDFGTGVSNQLCTAPTFGYTEDGTLYYCGGDQRLHAITAGGSLSATLIATALGYTPVSPTSLSDAIAAITPLTSANIIAALGYTPTGPSSLTAAIATVPTVSFDNIVTALGYTPVSPAGLANAVNAIPTVTSANIITALGYTPVSAATVASGYCPLGGCTLTGQLTLSADPGSALQAATKEYVDNQIAAKLGGGSGTGAGTFPTNIGTVNRTGVLTDGTVAYKTCYVGSSVCSGGVGSQAPSSTPQRVAGLSTPNANTGTANAVASHSVSTAAPQPTFTDVLWTTTGGGLGADSTSTNWYRDFWVKAAFPAGHTHLEFDTYDFASGWDWMWGTQCNATKNLIQYDNQTNGWVDTPVPCGNLFDGNYHHIQQTFHRDLAGTNNCANGTAPCQWWDGIAIDGTTYTISKSLPATTSTWSGSGGQIQLDTEPTTASSGSPATATLYVDTDIVTAGLAPDAGTTNPGGNGGGTSGTGELASFNFDSGLPSGVGITTAGSPSISTVNYHSAPNSALFPAGNNYFTDVLSSGTNTLYSRQYIYFTSLGTSANGFLRYYHSGSELFIWYLSTGGVLTAYDQATASDISSGYTVPLGSVHLIETYTKISATAGQVILKVDGTVQYTSAATLNTGTASVDTVWFGQIGNAAPTGWGSTYMDNVDFSAVGWIGAI